MCVAIRTNIDLLQDLDLGVGHQLVQRSDIGDQDLEVLVTFKSVLLQHFKPVSLQANPVFRNVALDSVLDDQTQLDEIVAG